VQALDADWNQIWVLDNRVQQGHPLEVTDDVRDLLRRSAPTVAISLSNADAAFTDVKTATALLQEIAARIRDGSHRLSGALHRMYGREEKGDLEGAREQMRELLAVERVPHYRDIAEGQLARLEDETD
jgi:DUSAM domain-containing protein